jgi:molybdenum cofactor sulfurtransferase
VYLDHAGTTLYARSLIDRFASDMTGNLFGNPHSASPSSSLSTQRIEDIRLRVLQFAKADPNEFDVVFVANATAGIRLVVDALRSAPDGFDFAYHQTSHTSLVGAREEARNSLCLDDAQVDAWLDGTSPFGAERSNGAVLFAYPAQSNMNGQRLPLSWATDLRQRASAGTRRVFTLLDVAAFAATSPLGLSSSESAPDFTVLSFYKIFGFPDLGALIVRREAEQAFEHRKYFGGGTVDMVVCLKEQWHAPKRQFLHERLEDGSLPIHSIFALDAALDVHARLFGSMSAVAEHTSFLGYRLRRGLADLRHGNGTSVCAIYSPNQDANSESQLGCGPVVAFNIKNPAGAWISLTEVEKLASLKKFHIRTGGLCNPGGIAAALDLQPWEMRRNFSAGFRCGTETDIVAGKPTGVIRASLGAMSTISDVDSFVAFVAEFFCEEAPPSLPQQEPVLVRQSELRIASIVVYPIKSCAGFNVPEATDWEVRPEGLAWDREWCLVHRGSGQALSQKRHPKMALIRPTLDFDRGELLVMFAGDAPSHLPKSITIPLSNNPSLFSRSSSSRPILPRVCGEEISPQTYASSVINEFFSGVFGVPCVLVRFPPGGQGKSMRHAKAHLQRHQLQVIKSPERVSLSDSFPGPPSPPDSDPETTRRRILLSNESPILAITTPSLAALNDDIVNKGGREVADAVFRANLVITPLDPGSQSHLPYGEDNWSTLRIGRQNFKALGACRRCHMVCINQETAEKSDEPFVTLSKTRRFDGKVFFGIHMGHVTPSVLEYKTREAQAPTIRVGDIVVPDSDSGPGLD